MEVIKSKLQAKPEYNTRDLIFKIYRNRGIGAFYTGYLATLGAFIPYSVIYFVAYERLKKQASIYHFGSETNDKLPVQYYAGCSAISGGVTAFATNALDTFKTRVQVGFGKDVNAKVKSKGGLFYYQMMKHMFKHEGGVRAFTRGTLQRVLYVVPSVSISFTIYEILK